MDVEGVWTCMGMLACKPKGRRSTVGGHTDARVGGNQRLAREMRVAGVLGRHGACVAARAGARLALDCHYSPESDDFARKCTI
ncbi:hypothetical protein CDL15_Pgr023839 [Punica granatum]|uniref:Uncharacterized protein n=1 Tax=Punica granatum TaxID=22663 RepID=A0A218VZ76_PUNGR|nr:hypothetical protein CDL15_Pgr023839 [Punica granatum]